ncbi:hypothetical protein CONPUDRAFT_150799 [Coniophora puteana RWD-64-598 SS2]|uniref:Uncharacterized protein n=1 Tax=Coniophora puteana (strain RWD-64-598) TaxID=741705 RepID=A0A5M3MXC9_CONPW|nr:uncharacterized protein CONPUDRAFT_150799 [Coniophora puteana RWD-64-598 SS2]EIW83736.1 hypothetical protein CONPUDRAFT_150799 [Coniophora puteana RWD-64-598 SS2]
MLNPLTILLSLLTWFPARLIIRVYVLLAAFHVTFVLLATGARPLCGLTFTASTPVCRWFDNMGTHYQTLSPFASIMDINTAQTRRIGYPVRDAASPIPAQARVMLHELLPQVSALHVPFSRALIKELEDADVKLQSVARLSNSLEAKKSHFAHSVLTASSLLPKALKAGNSRCSTAEDCATLTLSANRSLADFADRVGASVIELQKHSSSLAAARRYLVAHLSHLHKEVSEELANAHRHKYSTNLLSSIFNGSARFGLGQVLKVLSRANQEIMKLLRLSIQAEEEHAIFIMAVDEIRGALLEIAHSPIPQAHLQFLAHRMEILGRDGGEERLQRVFIDAFRDDTGQ